MEFIHSNWVCALFGLGTFIIGWLIKSFFAHQDRIKLEASIDERDNRLLAISRDQQKFITTKDAEILNLQSQSNTLSYENRHLTEHNTDLRKTILELKSTIQSDDEIITEVFSVSDDIIDAKSEVNQNISEIQTQTYGLLDQRTEEKISKVNLLPNYQKKWRKARKKLKKLVIENTKLKSKLATQNKILSKRPKPQTIVKEIPILITEEYLIKEQIDKKKLGKILSNKLPISKSKKLVNKFRKKGKPKIVKK